MEKENEGIGY